MTLRRTLLPALAVAGCNLTPTPWPDPTHAPGSIAPWSHPSDWACLRRPDLDEAFEVDGFLYCAEKALSQKFAVDDPVFHRCDDDRYPGRVMAVFDGRSARAYAIAHLYGRELVNDVWDGEPILADY